MVIISTINRRLPTSCQKEESLTQSILRKGFLGSAAHTGHFLLESGHHGDLWLDLELLCLQPRQMEGAVARLAEQLSRFDVDAVCGPLSEGAFLALLVAQRLDVEFTYSERFEYPQGGGLFPAQYRLPPELRSRVHGKRVAIVDDVINAGSAVRSTYADLVACGALPVALASLLVLGDAAARFAEEKGISLIALAQRPNVIWPPSECPLCAAGIPLEKP